jgi:hypothetical protein
MNFINFKSEVCPFNNDNFEFSKITNSFNSKVKVDSGYNQNSAGDTVKFYKFYDDKSRIIFSLNDYHKKSRKYNIAVFEINSNILIKKSAIYFNMPRNDFFQFLKYQKSDCDTIFINDYKPIENYYRIIFVNDTLKQIKYEYVME